VELEITPEPTDEERAAIEAALADDAPAFAVELPEP
jgi:hypothetical protein